MANFLGNLGAALQGQQNYQTWETQQEQAKLRIETEKENLAQIKDLAADAKAERKRKSKVDQGYLDALAGLGQPGIPPPPPSAQPPAPGQASVPMVQPQQAAQYGQRQISPPPPQGPGAVPPMPPGPGQQQGLMPPPGAGAPGPQQGPPQGPPPGPPQGQQMPPQGPQGPQQAQPPIPPYRTVQGASQQPQQGPQQGQQGIPPPPQQQPQMPRPGSMTLADAARFIQAQGITDPTTSVQILDKLTPYLDQQAQQQANQLKQQQLQQDKERALVEKAREADQNSKDKRYSTDQQAAWHQEAVEARKMLGLGMQAIAQQRVNNQTQSLKDKASSNSLSQDDLRFMAEQYWSGDKTVLQGLGRSPQALSAARHAIVEWGKDHGKTGADAALANAEFEGIKAGERALGTRTANVGLAVNEADKLSDLALKTSNEWQRTGIASLNELQALATKKGSSPELRRFVAANNSFINAYARAISPSGSPAQKEKDHARDTLNEGFSKGDYAATIDILKQEMEAAKTAPQATKEELAKLLKGEQAAATPKSPTVSGLALPSSKAELKKGQIYQTARGPAKWNGTAFEAQ